MTVAGWVTFVVVSLLTAGTVTAFRLGEARVPGGPLGAVVATLAGAAAGGLLLGDWLWVIGGYNVVGGVLGGLLVGYVAQIVAGGAASR